MITPIFHQTYVDDIELLVEGDSLNYRAPAGVMTEAYKKLLHENKNDLIERIIQNILASQQAWVVFNFGDMYTKQINEISHIFIFRNDDGNFTVWRGSWREGTTIPFSEKTIITSPNFNVALERANKYFLWATS